MIVKQDQFKGLILWQLLQEEKCQVMVVPGIQKMNPLRPDPGQAGLNLFFCNLITITIRAADILAVNQRTCQRQGLFPKNSTHIESDDGKRCKLQSSILTVLLASLPDSRPGRFSRIHGFVHFLLACYYVLVSLL